MKSFPTTAVFFFSIVVADDFDSVCNVIARLYSSLSNAAWENDENMWKITPKFHFLCGHLADQARRFGNPRFHWTYGDEDLVGLTIEVATSTHPRTTAIVALIKWAILAFDHDDDMISN